MSQNEHQNNTSNTDPKGKKPEKLDPKGNTESTANVPEQGQTTGASQPHQGTWEAEKGGEVIAPPERGEVSKPLEKDAPPTNET